MSEARDPVDHYDRLLAARYTWMLGGDHAAVTARQLDLLTGAGVGPGAGPALDLGAGPGYASVALARLGYGPVLAVDASPAMVAELAAALPAGPGIVPRLGDMATDIPALAAESGPFAVIACLGDTLVHLPDAAAVSAVLRDAAAALAPGGRLVLSFRDLTADPVGTERALLVRADGDALLTCVLHHVDAGHVRVRDLLHARGPDGTWSLRESSYLKLRLAPADVAAELASLGLVPGCCVGLPTGLFVVCAAAR